MDAAQKRHEYQVGDQPIEWYYEQHGASFCFDGRPGEAPDLKYRDEEHCLCLTVEVVSAYDDERDDAKFKWLRARGRPDAPKEWEGKNFDHLVRDITAKIAAKCANTYGKLSARGLRVRGHDHG